MRSSEQGQLHSNRERDGAIVRIFKNKTKQNWMMSSLCLTMQRVAVPQVMVRKAVFLWFRKRLLQYIPNLIHIWMVDIQNRRIATPLEITYLKLKLLCKLSGLKCQKRRRQGVGSMQNNLLWFQLKGHWSFKAKFCFAQKSPLGKYLWANTNSFCPTEITVLVYFNPHFAYLGTDTQRGEPKGTSLSMIQFWL